MTFQVSGIADLLATEVLSGIWIQSLADRTALPAHPAIIRVPVPPGSEKIRVPQVGMFGHDLLLLVDGADETVTSALVAHTDASVDITLARYSKHYDSSDLAGIVDVTGVVREQTFALDALVSAGCTLRDLIAGLVASFTTTVGTSTVDMTFENFLDAKAALLINKCEGPYLAILAPVQVTDLIKDLALNSGGAIQYSEGPQALLGSASRMGRIGSLAGVDLFATDSVTTSGGNRHGGMFGRGALGYAMAAPVADPDFAQIVLGNEVMYEKDRSGLTAVTSHISHMYVGVSEFVDLCGTSIITDA